MSSFSLTHWIITAAIIYVLARACMSVFGLTRGRDGMVCTTCGHHGRATRTTRGSIWIEVVLWLCLIVPGLVYSIWRLSTRADACTSCGGTTLVPEGSPVGRKLLSDQAGAGTRT